MAPRLSGQTSIFGVVFFVSKSLLGIKRQKKLEKFAILTRKPRSHARILIYRTWPIPRGLARYTNMAALTSYKNDLLLMQLQHNAVDSPKHITSYASDRAYRTIFN